eukprot:259810-Chlamydomonas_euryale.AAC.5
MACMGDCITCIGRYMACIGGCIVCMGGCVACMGGWMVRMGGCMCLSCPSVHPPVCPTTGSKVHVESCTCHSAPSTCIYAQTCTRNSDSDSDFMY